MAVSRLKPWTQFAELFASAEAAALDPVRVAKTLLQCLRDGERAEGLRQLYNPEKSAWTPRETHWRPVPEDAWTLIEEVASSGLSYWADDDETPETWVNLDWFAGALRWSTWYFDPSLEQVTEDFAALRIKGRAAENVLAAVAGRHTPKKGAPGRVEERPLIEEGVRLVADGHSPERAAALVATETEGHSLTLQLRRLIRNIRKTTAT